MEDVFSAIIVIIGAVATIVSSIKKQQKKAETHYPPIVTASPTQARPAAKPAQPVQPVQPVMSAPPAAEAPAAPAAPTVHTHLAPDCETHDAPGSLNFTRTEGKDPCHAEQLRDEREPLPEEETTPGLTLEWSGEAMVKAFVMQEVLARPGQRRAR